jgi:hypothetical protein
MITTITFNFQPRPQSRPRKQIRLRFIPVLETILEDRPFENNTLPNLLYAPRRSIRIQEKEQRTKQLTKS